MKRRVLIAEDDFAYETILRRILLDIDSQLVIESTSSAEVALAMLRQCVERRENPYDLALVDIFLDGATTGLELWQAFQELSPGTPVIVISGLPIEKFYETIGRNTICPPFLAKPFFSGECRQLIESLYRRKEAA